MTVGKILKLVPAASFGGVDGKQALDGLHGFGGGVAGKADPPLGIAPDRWRRTG